jgi:hypothetical protein
MMFLVALSWPAISRARGRNDFNLEGRKSMLQMEEWLLAVCSGFQGFKEENISSSLRFQATLSLYLFNAVPL